MCLAFIWLNHSATENLINACAMLFAMLFGCPDFQRRSGYSWSPSDVPRSPGMYHIELGGIYVSSRSQSIVHYSLMERSAATAASDPARESTSAWPGPSSPFTLPNATSRLAPCSALVSSSPDG
jgi:hypothetical protein